MKPHKHAEVIKAWADGAEIECKYYKASANNWHPIDSSQGMYWRDDFEYRVKPEKEYPHTSIPGKQLYEIYHADRDDSSCTESLLRVADAVLKQYIIDLEKEQS